MKKKPYRISLLVILLLFVNTLSPAHMAVANPTIPPTWDIISDNFESGSLSIWKTKTPEDLHLETGSGRNGSAGLRVDISSDEAYIYQSHIGNTVEGYLTFWFNPNGVVLPDSASSSWPPGAGLRVIQITSTNSDWQPLVELCVSKAAGQNYQGYLAWPKAGGYFYDDEDGKFALADGWQKITLGYHIDSWVAVWLNDTLVHSYDSDITHKDPSGDVIILGKRNTTTGSFGGSILLDEVTYQLPRMDDLWVNASGGKDSNDGLTRDTAFLTIQKAADLAGPGTTVHILPGIYRETVLPLLDGTPSERITYVAEDGPGTVILRGSEPASSLTWTQLTGDTIGLPGGVDATQIYYADLSAWELESAPRFVMQMEGLGTRLPLAREPDWEVETEWKTHEFWWAADGGSSVAACTPAPGDERDCDLAQRSTTQLTDLTNDAAPAGIEAGNLTTLGDLTGATLLAMDTLQGHYTYRRTITAHDVANGRITVNKICEHDGGTGNPGLGWGTKYTIENSPRLLDSPGEWWYDTATQRLYLWPPSAGNPAAQNIEISKRDSGFSLQNRSYTTLDGLTIELVNGIAVYARNWTDQKSYDNIVRNIMLRYANSGVVVEASVSASSLPGNIIDGFTLENSEIADMDSYGLLVGDWWENSAAADSYTHSGVINTIIRNNEFHHLGFRSDGDAGVGLAFRFANQLRFENNHVHHIAHNGVHFSNSVIQSSKTYGFEPSEIKTGDILVKDNIFERACQLGADCGGLKFWGSGPDNHVYRNVLIVGNIFRDTYGWSYIAEKRGRYSGGTNSQVRGMGGYGLFVDHASGLHAYRNIAYNNAAVGYTVYGVWRDGEIVYYNNIAANSLTGFSLGGPQYDTHGNVNTQIVNNIILNNEGYGVSATAASGNFENVTIDHNLYFNNGWRPNAAGGVSGPGDMVVSTSSPHSWNPYHTLEDIQANTTWEDHGIAGDPALWNYDEAEHELFDGSWPDFHLTSASSLIIDQGTEALPASLVALLNQFGVTDNRLGAAYDIGRYEGGFTLAAEPAIRAISPGGVAQYRLCLQPNDLTQAIALAANTPSSDLLLDLAPTAIAGADCATLTITDTHTTESLLSAIQYSIPITGTGGGFTQTTTVKLLVGGVSTYLPLMLK